MRGTFLSRIRTIARPVERRKRLMSKNASIELTPKKRELIVKTLKILLAIIVCVRKRTNVFGFFGYVKR